MCPAKLSNLARCSTLLACMLPATAFSQSLGDLFKTLQQVTSSGTINAVGVFKSFTETLQGQVAPGTHAEDAQGKVVLYRTSWCNYCKKASAYMQSRGIPFAERDIETNVGYKAEYQKLGGTGGVPFIVFGQKTIMGFNEASFDKNYAEFQVAQANPPAGAGQGPESPRGQPTGQQAGQILVGKIPGVKIYAQANKSAEKLLVLNKTDEVIYMGEERNGLYLVTTQKGEGWVDKLLVKNP